MQKLTPLLEQAHPDIKVKWVTAEEGARPRTVDLVESLGAETLIYVTIDGGPQIIARQATRTTLHNGGKVGVFVDAAKTHRFDPQGRAVRAD